MTENQLNSPTEVFIREVKGDGFDLDRIPVQMGKVGDYFGKPGDGTAIDEAAEKLVPITAANLSKLGGRQVAVDGVSVKLQLMGKPTEVNIDRLRFTRGTARWAAQIRDQVPQIAWMVELRRRIREVQNNPNLKKQLVAWIRANPVSKQLLDEILNNYDH